MLVATILGCGSSSGVPRVGGGWGACNPDNPRNRRRRCSLLLEREGPAGVTRVLIDTSPDLREQLLDAKVDHLDAILFTHEHADHTHGIDDVRPLVLHQRRRIDAYMDAPTAQSLLTRFGYCFATPPGSQYPPILTQKSLEAGKPVVIDGPGGSIEALPFALAHGDVPALGFRIGGLAYTPDVKDVPADSLDALSGLETWIVDALRFTRHPSHWCVDETLDWIGRLKPKRAVITNMHVDIDYDALRERLPPDAEPAFDGMQINVP
jgi:phosphoribosyl 1,2-cyclic phosphate phosphodiesterase